MVCFVRAVFAFLMITFATCCAAQTVDPVRQPQLPDVLHTAVQDPGSRVLDKEGAPLVSLWLAKSVLSSKKEIEGANYPQLPVSAFMGVIAFETEAKDFRGQTIPKGTYTLRYALLPNDGNHMGVAPNRDFLLLLPLTSDSDPHTTYPEKQLYRASAKVAGGGHPTVLSLIADEGKPGTVSATAEGYIVFHGSAGDVPIALIVKGVAQQ